ncbi:MAG: ATP-binding protein [Deltaproteobacteria bacterium]|nr:ATP-binding protein [Deltaproteobacteria bacterium]
MIERDLRAVLKASARKYPVVTLTGPRQSGKTTLCRAAFPKKEYVTLEALDVREYATQDPKGFLAEHRAGAILDEIQHAPGLLSYLQGEVDDNPAPGRFVLTGSQHLAFTAAVAQSLAGRTAVLTLLPASLKELRRFPKHPDELWATVWAGGYPRIHDRHVPADRWLADYLTTYVQRDVRQVLNVGDLQAFTTFLRLCAGHTGQVLNLSALGGDCGVSHNTARAWLSVLEASYILFRLPPWHRNLKKQLTKAPKLHFFDSGLACHLLGLRQPSDLVHHPLRGALFESFVVAEAYKARVNHGLAPDLFYFRDHKGLEVDLVVESPSAVVLAEVKSGETVADDFFAPLRRVSSMFEAKGGRATPECRVVYGGAKGQRRSDVRVVSWRELDAVGW